MSVEEIHFLVEEPSMEAALRAFLPRILRAVRFEIFVHQGKSELLRKLPQRLAGYGRWLPPSYRIVVLVDRDDDDCDELKARVESVVAGAGLVTRAKNPVQFSVVTRIAIEELEAWYFGDWAAVRAAYPKVSARVPTQERFRHPDAVRGGTWEAFERILQGSGYFVAGLRKVEAARAVGAHMLPARNGSPSFQRLRDVLAEFAA